MSRQANRPLANAALQYEIAVMHRAAALLLGIAAFVPGAASAQQVAQVRLSYDTYAAGIEVMQLQAFFGLGPWNYQLDVNYHTTGLVGIFYRGHQVNTVRGIWENDSPEPIEFFGEGVWRGKPRRTRIDYDHGQPEIKDLAPPQESEREPVPHDLQTHAVDTLSALAQLMRKVEHSHSCDTSVRTFDGRRVLEVAAHTAGPEKLDATSRSAFRGEALRCDFEGRELAGFLFGENDAEHRQPLKGSAWLAPMLPGAPPLPVRIAFQTRWFGWATMYLTEAADGAKRTDTARN